MKRKTKTAPAPKPDVIPVLTRLPRALLERTDAHAETLAAAQPGQRVTRADVIRLALHAYLP